MIDIDAHHGNGTQAIFYEDPRVLVGSVHVDPGAGWFPHFLGFAAETGGAGEGANRNVPLPPGNRGRRVAGGRRASWPDGREQGPAGWSSPSASTPREATREPASGHRRGFRRAGHALGALGLPTVFVQEGGYDLEAIGPLGRGPGRLRGRG